jgi:polysaccharide export outer membrane protein
MSSLFGFHRSGPASKMSVFVLVTLLAGSVSVALAQQAPVSEPSQTKTPSVQASASDSPQKDDRYRIGTGDVLEIRVFNRPQLSLEAARVDGRGMIRMPLIEDDMRAACRTESELAQEIADRYRPYQRNPQVFVFVREYNSQPVAVIGAVDKPGRFQLQRRVRLLELVSLAGGPTEKAGKRVQIARTGGVSVCAEAEAAPATQDLMEGFAMYDLNETLVGDHKSNPYIQPGDIITIPEAEQAFVTGNVFRPTAIPLKEPITVSQAIAMAGGTLPDSNLNQVRIIRRVPKATSNTEMVANLRAISQRRAADVMLQSGDIVEVPTLSGKKFLRSFFATLAPMAATLPIYILR